MSQMFQNCLSLAKIDVSHFDTSKVTDMSYMFYGLYYNLTSLDVSNFDTRNVTGMSSMFKHCEEIITLNVSSFDVKTFVFENDISVDDITNYVKLLNGESLNITQIHYIFWFLLSSVLFGYALGLSIFFYNLRKKK